jgi:electron transport complex protein RnfB
MAGDSAVACYELFTLHKGGDMMTDTIFRRLQKRLDKYSVGFPATDSGVELTILEKLFSEKDAAMFLDLTPILETAESVATRLYRPVGDIAPHLEDMAKRGLLFRLQKNDSIKYGAIPFVHGLLEFQVKRLDREMAKLFEDYYEAGFKNAFIESSDTFLRTIPVNESIDVLQKVASYDDACEILRNVKTIVVTDCICRKMNGLIDKGCDKPLEACFMFGSMAQYYLDHKMGREIDYDEAIQILENAREAGLVTQPATSQNPSGMCNCCGDCCGVLSTLNKLSNPADFIFSNHFAVVHQEDCTGCETCLDRCQMCALSMTDDDCVEINPDRCIGCGLCVTSCPTEAIGLVLKSEEARRVPPASAVDQMIAMAKKRGVQF